MVVALVALEARDSLGIPRTRQATQWGHMSSRPTHPNTSHYSTIDAAASKGGAAASGARFGPNASALTRRTGLEGDEAAAILNVPRHAGPEEIAKVGIAGAALLGHVPVCSAASRIACTYLPTHSKCMHSNATPRSPSDTSTCLPKMTQARAAPSTSSPRCTGPRSDWSWSWPRALHPRHRHRNQMRELFV
jgi:hypothetical protein